MPKLPWAFLIVLTFDQNLEDDVELILPSYLVTSRYEKLIKIVMIQVLG
jgi:hypothetical protein